jgi:hypothetical protein
LLLEKLVGALTPGADRHEKHSSHSKHPFLDGETPAASPANPRHEP